MSDTVSQIKERLSIEEVLGSYIKLEKSGINLKAVCPFHKEKTPSFLVSPQRGSYYCFGCGAKGDIFSFVEAFEGLDFKGALEVLAKKAGVEIKSFSGTKKQEDKEKFFSIMENACSFFEKELLKNKDAIDYLHTRGVKDESIKSFRIGFAPKSWQLLKDYLISKGFDLADITALGLLKEGEKGKIYDRFRSRIMFPICDLGGRVIAFSGRDFDPTRKPEEIVPAKYINSPETVLFSKGSVFYGLDKAKDSIREKKFSILVEGQMDLVMSHQSGFANTIAASGTALLDKEYKEEGVLNHLGVIKRLSDKIILAYDSDKAGLKASARSTKITLALGMEVFITKSEKEGEDPADIIKDDPKRWQEIIKNAVPALVYFTEILNSKSKDRMHFADLVSKKLIPFFAAIPSSIVKNETIKSIATKFNLSEDSILEDLNEYIEKNKNTYTISAVKDKDKTEEAKIKRPRRESIIKRSMAIMFWLFSKEDPPYDPNILKDKLKQLLGEEFNFYETGAESIKQELLFEIDNLYNVEKISNWEIEELLSGLNEALLQEKLTKKKEEIDRYEEIGNEESYKKNLLEYLDLGRKIEEERHKRITL